MVSQAQVTPHCIVPVSALRTGLGFRQNVCFHMYPEISAKQKQQPEIWYSVFFMAVGMANGVACTFPMSQALRSTARVEQ